MVLIELDKEITFSDDILPACLDWNNFYDAADFTDGNEAVVSNGGLIFYIKFLLMMGNRLLRCDYTFSLQAVGWTYDKDEVIPCEPLNEFNVQYWQFSTCKENLQHDSTFWYLFDSGSFCAAYTGGNRSFKVRPYTRSLPNSVA